MFDSNDEKVFENGKYILISIVGFLIYFLIDFIEFSMIGNLRFVFVMLILKILSFTFSAVGINILIIHYYNHALKDSKIMNKLAIVRAIIITVTIFFINSAFISQYSSFICTKRFSENYLMSVGYFYDIVQIPKIIINSDSDNKEEYVGEIIVNPIENSFIGIDGSSGERISAYYITSSENDFIGVIKRNDLACISVNKKYKIIYYKELKLIESIEPVS